MTKPKVAPLFYPDLITHHPEAPSVVCLYQLWGFRGPGGLVSIGQIPADSRKEILTERLKMAKGIKK